MESDGADQYGAEAPAGCHHRQPSREVSGEGYGSLAAGNPTPYHGDFVSPEQMIPPNGIQDVNGNDIAWESCVTMNNHWGYCANDHFFKPAPMLIKKLVECVSKGETCF